jgi:hypothetical protein
MNPASTADRLITVPAALLVTEKQLPVPTTTAGGGNRPEPVLTDRPLFHRVTLVAMPGGPTERRLHPGQCGYLLQ